MKILVFLKEVPDTRIPLEYDEHCRALRDEGQVSQLNPPDRAALAASLMIKEHLAETHIALIHFGPSSGERWIREGLALGCDEGWRIWDDSIQGVRAAGKALIFSRIAEILGFDLILTGNMSLDTASEQLGVLLARHLEVPHINAVIELELSQENQNIIARKRLDRGFQERVQCSLPLVVAIEANGDSEESASFSALLEAMDKEIPCWDLAQIGIPAEQIIQTDSLLHFEPLRFPRPRLKTLSAPDISLPTFERIKKLLEGTIQRRGGKIIQHDEDRLVEELFQTLLQEGWLDHLQKEH